MMARREGREKAATNLAETKDRERKGKTLGHQEGQWVIKRKKKSSSDLQGDVEREERKKGAASLKRI